LNTSVVQDKRRNFVEQDNHSLRYFYTIHNVIRCCCWFQRYHYRYQHSDLAATYSNRGIISARKGDFEQALADHNKALELKPGLSQAHINRGNTYYHLGQFEAAIRDYKTALDKGDTPAYLPYYNYGLALIKLKRTQEAIKMLEKALAIAPEASQVKRKLEDLMEQ
jgi:tetratricopeptide (TPR) repeat protein